MLVNCSSQLFGLLYQLYRKITGLTGIKVSAFGAKGSGGFSFDHNRDSFPNQFGHLLVKVIYRESNVLNTEVDPILRTG